VRSNRPYSRSAVARLFWAWIGGEASAGSGDAVTVPCLIEAGQTHHFVKLPAP